MLSQYFIVDFKVSVGARTAPDISHQCNSITLLHRLQKIERRTQTQAIPTPKNIGPTVQITRVYLCHSH